mmetsp:Transcript_109154/g.315382  ORF Transcript_109154/g.315382 Transcript_109154/m.315382 type:complete len:469 (-) Transcript_109154:86-1492(-)
MSSLFAPHTWSPARGVAMSGVGQSMAAASPAAQLALLKAELQREEALADSLRRSPFIYNAAPLPMSPASAPSMMARRNPTPHEELARLKSELAQEEAAAQVLRSHLRVPPVGMGGASPFATAPPNPLHSAPAQTATPQQYKELMRTLSSKAPAEPPPSQPPHWQQPQWQEHQLQPHHRQCVMPPQQHLPPLSQHQLMQQQQQHQLASQQQQQQTTLWADAAAPLMQQPPPPSQRDVPVQQREGPWADATAQPLQRKRRGRTCCGGEEEDEAPVPIGSQASMPLGSASSLRPVPEEHREAVERGKRLYLEGRLEGFEVLKPMQVFVPQASGPPVTAAPPAESRRELRDAPGLHSVGSSRIPSGAALGPTPLPSATSERGLPSAGGCGGAGAPALSKEREPPAPLEPAVDHEATKQELEHLYEELHRRMAEHMDEEERGPEGHGAPQAAAASTSGPDHDSAAAAPSTRTF